MQKSEIVWRSDDDWKARYSKLYSSRRLSQPVEDPTRHISFMGRAIAPKKMLLMKAHAKRNSDIYGETPDAVKPIELTALLSPQDRSSTSYAYSIVHTPETDNSIDTLLLEMVRAKSRENEEMQDKTLELREDVSDDQSSEACVHGLSVRMTDRSISRRSMSRISRVSTRRDMDIPSLMAFTATVTPAPAPLEIPAFRKAIVQSDETPPRWSIRRSMCPVCSQKWKDKSSINNIKNSGLKRNSSADLPTVIAPARLRSAITMEYNPRPALAAVDDKKYYGFMRNTKATWQLTRARRFRTPKLQMPPPEATAPPSSTAPMALKDLNTRVNRFLTDEGMDKYLLEASFTL